MKEKGIRTLDKILDAVDKILGIGDAFSFNWGSINLKRASLGGVSVCNKKLVVVNYYYLRKYAKETNKENKKYYYAQIAGIAAHEVMHIVQYVYSFEKYKEEFMYAANLPPDEKWSIEETKKYNNLYIEIEASAFGDLVEATLLNETKIPTPHEYTDIKIYSEVYLKLKDKYEDKIKEAFSNLRYSPFTPRKEGKSTTTLSSRQGGALTP